MEYTPGEWTVKDIPSHGLEIFAEVNMGKDENGGVLQPIYNVDIRPYLKVCNDGIAELMIAYESWRQFPSVNFEKMQRANARLISQAPKMYEALKGLQPTLKSMKKSFLHPVMREIVNNALKAIAEVEKK